MHNFFVLILFFLCFLMFTVSRPLKMGILLLAGMCIYEYHLPITFYGSTFIILPLCFILSEIQPMVNIIWIRRYPLFSFLLIVGLIYIVYSILVSPHLEFGVKYFFSNYLCRYLLPIIAIVCIKKKKDMMIIYKYALCGVVIMTIFGIHNLIFKVNN